MADTVNTELKWVVDGENQIRSMAAALEKLVKAQRDMNAVLGKSGKTTVSYSQMLDAQRKMKTTVSETAKGVRSIKHEITEVANRTQKANQRTRDLLISWQSVGRIIVGSLISRGIGKLLRVLGDATGETTEFQIRISELRTISQESQLAFGHWADEIKRLSDEFNRAPLDVAEAAYQTLSNQVAEGTQALNFLQESLRLSLITVSSAEDAVQALTAAINAYGYTVADARYLSDIFFKTIELGRLRLTEIANTIGRVYILGDQLGITLEEINASLASLTIQGIKASEAQTWLRNVMLKLIRPTDRMKEILGQWGVTSGQAAIETFGFAGVLEKLKEVAQSGEGELAELSNIFNRIRATAGAAGLIGNIENFKEALEKMATAGRDAAKAFDLVRESAGFKMQQELQKLKNFFTIELGQEILQKVYEFTEGMGGLSKTVERLTRLTIKLGLALALVFSASVAAQIGAVAFSLIRVASAAGLAAAATAALKYQVTLLGFSFSALSLGIGAAIAAVALIGYEIWSTFEEAKKPVLEFADTMRSRIFAALSDVAAKEAEVNAARVRATLDTTRLITQTYRQAIADQVASLIRLEQIENDRVNLQSLLFDFQMRTASMSKREQLVYERLVFLRKELHHALAQETRDWKEINAIQSEITKTHGLAQQFQDAYFRTSVKIGESTAKNSRRQEVWKEITTKGSRRIQNLMKAITQDVQNVNREHAKFPITQKETIDKLRESIESQEEQVKLIKDAEERQKQLKKLSEDTAAAQVKTIGSMTTAVNKLGNAYYEASKAALYKNLFPVTGASGGGGRYILSPELWEELKLGMDSFNTGLANLRENLAGAQKDGFLSPEEINLLKQQLNEVMAAYYGGLRKHIPIQGFEEMLSTMRDAIENAGELAEQKLSLQHKFEMTEYAIQTASEEAKNFKTVLEELGTSGEMGQVAIQNAANTTSQSLSSMVIWLNMALRTTNQNIERLNIAIQKAEELNRITSGQPAAAPSSPESWKGGLMTRFATGGSVASDTVAARLQPGEFVMSKTAARRYFPQLVAMNSGAARFNSGGEVTNNNIGDINVTVRGGDTSEVTARRIATELRREIRRGTVRLN